MNHKYLLLLSIIPVFFLINISENVIFSETLQAEKTGIVGHVTMIVQDENGNIRSYTQGDNDVVNNGENCALKLLFQMGTGDAGNTVCTGANTVGFRYIGLEESATAVAETDVTLNDAADSAGLSTPLLGLATWTNSSGTSSSASVDIEAVFTNSGASETITGAGLFNSTDIEDGMFAHKLAASSATVNTSDTLTVTWTITIAGA